LRLLGWDTYTGWKTAKAGIGLVSSNEKGEKRASTEAMEGHGDQ